MLAITNLITQSQSSYPNNKFTSCPPNEKGLIPLGQKNFTKCLQHNPLGDYILVNSINFSNFSDEEKRHYPMYNFSSPFTGALDTGDHHIADLYLNRTGMSALFGAIANSTFRVHFKNSYVMGTNHTAVLAAMARDHNTINMTVDHATAITICPPNIPCESNNKIFQFSGATAIVLGYAQGSDLSIYFRAQSTHAKTEAPYADVGIVAGRLSDSSINMNVNTHFSQLTSSGHYAYAGAVGYHNFKICDLSCPYFFKAQTNFNNISIFSRGTFSAAGATVGGLLGYIHYDTQDIRPTNTINSTINTITIHASGKDSYSSACVGIVENRINTLNVNVNNAHLVILNESTYSALAIGWSVKSSNTIYAKANTFTSNNTGDNIYAGGIVGHITGFQAQFQKQSHAITAHVGKTFIRNTGQNSFTGMMVGHASLEGESLKLWLHGGHINLLTNATPSALIIGYLNDIGKG